MTERDDSSSNEDRSFDVVGWLIHESRNYTRSEDFVDFLARGIGQRYRRDDILYSIGALRAAVTRCLDEGKVAGAGDHCAFCGKSRDQVRTIFVSAHSAICDECAITAVEGISLGRHQLVLRIAFGLFKVVASLRHVVRGKSAADSQENSDKG